MGMEGGEGKRDHIWPHLLLYTKSNPCALTHAKIGTLAAFGAIMGPLLPPASPHMPCPLPSKPPTQRLAYLHADTLPARWNGQQATLY